MTTLNPFILTLTLLLNSTAFAGAATKPETLPAEKPWNQKMKTLAQSLKDIIPDLYKADPKTPKEAADLKEKSRRLQEAAQAINLKDHQVNSAVPDKDPSLIFISDMFREEIADANKGIQQGFYSYSKNMIKSSITYCITCHTRNASGPQFPLLDAFSEPLKNANWIDKIKIQAATRQFDAAEAEVQKQLDDPNTLETKMGLEDAIQVALSIAIRVKKSPEQALKICKAIDKSKRFTSSLKDRSIVWSDDIRKWKKEIQNPPKTDKELMARAKTWLAMEGSKSYERLPSGEVKYILASEWMHQLLREYPQSDLVPEAFYILGICYESTNDLTLGPLNEKYYEHCIRMKPQSSIAKNCYQALKESIEFGYSGSSGTHVPPLVEERLQRLKLMTEAKKK